MAEHEQELDDLNANANVHAVDPPAARDWIQFWRFVGGYCHWYFVIIVGGTGLGFSWWAMSAERAAGVLDAAPTYVKQMSDAIPNNFLTCMILLLFGAARTHFYTAWTGRQIPSTFIWAAFDSAIGFVLASLLAPVLDDLRHPVPSLHPAPVKPQL